MDKYVGLKKRIYEIGSFIFKKKFGNLFFIFILIFFLLTGKFNLLKDRLESWMGKDRGKKIADMQFTFLQNNKRENLSLFKGKILLVNIWATWCPPCRVEIPGFIDLYGKYRDKGVEIIGVSIDSKGTKAVKDFIKSEKINYPVTMADQDILQKFSPIVAVPTSFLLDKNGIVRKKYSGFYLKSTFETDLNSLLGKSDPKN